MTFLGVFIIRNTYYHIVKPVFFSIITYDNPSPKFYLDLTSKYKLINSLETIVTSDYILNENHNKLYIKDYAADNKIMIDINLFKDFVWGQTFKFSKVSYEDGKQDYKIGNDTEKTLYCNILLEKLKIEPLYDKIQYNEFLKNISPLLKKELLDIAENYEIEILVDKYPITNNKMQFLDDEMDIYITKNDSNRHPLESYPEIYFRDTVNSWKKCEFMKSRKQKIFILNIELNEEKWEKLPEFKIMPKIEHKNVFPPVFKKIENNIFDIVYIPRECDDDDLGFSISEELLKKMIGLGYDVEIISNKDRFFNTHSPYKLKTEKDILWVYDYENNWYILPLLDFDTLERKVIDGEVITYTTTSVQVYHEKYCPDGKLYFQKSEIKDYGISDAIHLGFGEWVVNEYQKLIESYKTKI